MTKEEFKNIFADSKNVEWFNNMNVIVPYQRVNKVLNFTSITLLYEYVYDQVRGWEKISHELPKDFINQNQPAIVSVLQQVEHFVNTWRDNEEGSLNGIWQAQVQKNINNLNNTFPSDSKEVKFLINAFKYSQEYFNGALYYFTNQISSTFSTKERLEGGLLAFQFINGNNPLSNGFPVEKDSIDELKRNLQEYLSRTEKHLIEHLNNSNQKFKDITEETISYKNTKEKEVNDWLTASQTSFTSFTQSSSEKIQELEKVYEEQLRLKKPAEFWEKRAKKLKCDGRIYLGLSLVLMMIGSVSVYKLLWETPDGMLESVFNGDKAKAIRWSIVFVAFISLIFVGIRFLSKLMFSSFHLTRDAEERQQLTHVYLALIKENAIDEKDRQLIMQSLFSRADSGLLKDDSSPTMPNGVEKIIGR